MSLKDEDITDEDKLQLTDEERGALAEGDEVDDDDPDAEGNETPEGEEGEDVDAAEQAEKENPAGDEDASEGADKGAAADETTGTEKTAEEIAAEATAAAEAEATAAADKGATEKSHDAVDVSAVFDTPLAYIPPMPPGPAADADEKLNEIELKKDKLLEDFDNGEMTSKEYQKQLDTLNDQKSDIKNDIRDAQRDQKTYTQALTAAWQQDCNTFMAKNPIYMKNETLGRALDAEVKRLADPKVNTAGLTDRQILIKADQQIKEAFGIAKTKDAPDDKTTAAETEKPKTTVKKVVVVPKKLPPTLAKIPAAESTDTGEGKFAALDRLASKDPEAFEEQMMAMSEKDRKDYERA